MIVQLVKFGWIGYEDNVIIPGYFSEEGTEYKLGGTVKVDSAEQLIKSEEKLKTLAGNGYNLVVELEKTNDSKMFKVSSEAVSVEDYLKKV